MIKNNIRKLRRSQKLSQRQLAEVLDVQQTQISKWELGKSEPDEDDLDILADFFDVSPAFVLGETMDRRDYTRDELYAAEQFLAGDDYEREILEVFRFLPESGKSHLLMTARMLEKYYRG